MKVKNKLTKSYLILIITLQLTLPSCTESNKIVDGSLTANAIETLCLWGEFDKASDIYTQYFKNNSEIQSYLNNRTALRLFSHTNQKSEYFKYLREYVKFHGEIKQVSAFTKDNFYSKYEQEILGLFQNTPKQYIGKTDSLVIADFLVKDQEIRINGNLTKERDSLNQIDIKELIAQRKYNNKYLREAMTLLIRHVSPEYLNEYKESGLLEHYASISMLTKEEYYDAVSYITGNIYLSKFGRISQDRLDSLNVNRESVGLLPNKFSPAVNQFKSFLTDYKKPSREEINILSEELFNYITAHNSHQI